MSYQYCDNCEGNFDTCNCGHCEVCGDTFDGDDLIDETCPRCREKPEREPGAAPDLRRFVVLDDGETFSELEGCSIVELDMASLSAGAKKRLSEGNIEYVFDQVLAGDAIGLSVQLRNEVVDRMFAERKKIV